MCASNSNKPLVDCSGIFTSNITTIHPRYQVSPASHPNRHQSATVPTVGDTSTFYGLTSGNTSTTHVASLTQLITITLADDRAAAINVTTRAGFSFSFQWIHGRHILRCFALDSFSRNINERQCRLILTSFQGVYLFHNSSGLKAVSAADGAATAHAPRRLKAVIPRLRNFMPNSRQ